LNDGSIGTLGNSGLIRSSNDGIHNNAGGTMTVLNNSGTITGNGFYGIVNDSGGTIGTLMNSGSISGGQYGFYNLGTIGTLANSTVTLGSLSSAGSIGGSLTGVYNGGTATLVNNQAIINGSATGLFNTGTLGTLTNTGSINGNTGVINLGMLGTFTNGVSGTVSGITAVLSGHGTLGTLSNAGMLVSQNYGPAIQNNNNAVINTLTNTGTLSSANNAGVRNSGRIDALSNSGVVSSQYGVFNDRLQSTIGTLFNSGTINSQVFGVGNAGTIGTLFNTGAIGGSSRAAVSNGGTITSLTNDVGGDLHSDSIGIFNTGAIGALTNRGTIAGGANAGISNGGTTSAITALTNEAGASIRSGATGVYNGGTVGALSNAGTISGTTVAGVANDGSIGTLTNRGLISSDSSWGLYNTGTISALSNSGTIMGSVYAINNVDPTSSLGAITNSGVIAGNILQASSRDLTINGGTGSTFGTLTGFGGTIGTLANTASNVVFGTGNQVLNDNVDVGSHTVMNTAGALQVNNAISITGNYSQAAAATLRIGANDGAVATGSLANDTGYGRLVVSGSATVDAGSSIALQTLHRYAFAAGQRFVVIDAASSGTNYNAGSLNYSASGFTGMATGATVTDGGRSDLVVTLANTPSPAPTPAPVQNLATTPNAVAALSGLANYSGLSPELLNLFNASKALSLGSAADANRAGAQLGPASQAAGTRAANAPTLDVLNAVSDRLNSSRSAQAGVSTGDAAPTYGAWGQALGGHVSQGARDQVDGYRANYGGLLFGADAAIGERWRAGGLFSYTNTSIRNTGETDGDTMRVNAYGLIGYASYAGAPWYVNLAAGVVQQDYDTSRTVNFTGFSGQANGQFTGKQYVARAEAGYPLAIGAYTVTPLASLTYSHLRQNGYTETGGNGAGLSVGDTHLTSATSDLGAKLERAFTTACGTVVPYIQVSWRHEYGNAQQRINARFVADPTGETGFTTMGAGPTANMGVLLAGVTLLRANNLSLTARYTLQAAPHFVSHAGSVRLRLAF